MDMLPLLASLDARDASHAAIDGIKEVAKVGLAAHSRIDALEKRVDELEKQMIRLTTRLK